MHVALKSSAVTLIEENKVNYNLWYYSTLILSRIQHGNKNYNCSVILCYVQVLESQKFCFHLLYLKGIAEFLM